MVVAIVLDDGYFFGERDDGQMITSPRREEDRRHAHTGFQCPGPRSHLPSHESIAGVLGAPHRSVIRVPVDHGRFGAKPTDPFMARNTLGVIGHNRTLGAHSESLPDLAAPATVRPPADFRRPSHPGPGAT